MRHLGQGLKRFVKDHSGAYSTEWIAVMSMAIILTIGAVYTIVGGSYVDENGQLQDGGGLHELAVQMQARTEEGNADIENLINALPSQDD